MVICLEWGADLHVAQLIPLPLTVSCYSKIQIGFTFLVPAYPGSLGKRAVKRVCVCVCVSWAVSTVTMFDWAVVDGQVVLMQQCLSWIVMVLLLVASWTGTVESSSCPITFCFRTGQGPCCANLHKWGLAQSPFRDCGQQQQTMNHMSTCAH